MDNQHNLIKGYRNLSQDEIDLMNEVKAKAEEVKALISKVREHLNKTCKYEQQSTVVQEGDKVSPDSVVVGYNGKVIAYGPSDETRRWQAAEPYEWTSRAKDNLQDGFMKLTRAIAQPTTF